jgi:hypothetical protein
MVKEDERRLILGMIESGKISATEGLELLKALGEDQPLESGEVVSEDSPLPPGQETLEDRGSEEGAEIPDPFAADEDQSLTGEVLDPVKTSLPPDVDQWRRWWRIPMWVGVGITTLGGLLLFWAQQTYGIGFLFFCAWVPLLLGVLLIVLGWQSRTSRWLHVRIRQQPGEWPQKIAFSFPIPVRMTAWFFRNFRGTIPGMDNIAMDELLVALDQSASPENPLYVEVEDDEDGERVEIYIG